MAATKKPWEDVVSFDDWKQEVNDDSQTEEPGKSYAQNSAPQEIQGIGISNDDEDIDLNDMIASLNQQNAGYVEKAKAEEKEQRECMASVLEATVSADVRFTGCRLRADFQLCSDGGADYRIQRLQDHWRTERNVYKSMGGFEIFQRIFYRI